MRMIRNPIVLAGIAAATCLPAPSLAGQLPPARSQAEIAAALRSTNRDTVAHALAEVPLGYDPGDLLGWKFPPDYVVTPELAAGLISALDREAREHMDGCTVTGIGERHLELSLELAHYVIALRDPATIPALVQVICTGGGVRQALMELGPVVVPHVVAWARSPDAAEDDISASLIALGAAVERWGETLPPQARASISEVALQYLGPPPERIVASWEKGREWARKGLAGSLWEPLWETATPEIVIGDHRR